ncbi:hypothetical protein PVAP13_3NG195178 [Panicum virgatum]|uniref:Uncharacterized protein n=1 Tax=Panicum virgatum TaxID=38727 RepID=A0A8T0UIZ6_PANVG|nr:hypothetical protein PVAP13_3NG195178 [Panicum virgatum]
MQGQITSPVSSPTPQPLIKKRLRVGKEDRTHDPEQGNQEPHHYATCWASNSDHQDQKGKPYQLLYTFGCDDEWYYPIYR